MGDYTPDFYSPAYNAGSNAVDTGAKDLAGNTRVMDTTVDIGALEMFGAAAAPSRILAEPQPQTIREGDVTSFTVTGADAASGSFFWYKYNGTSWIQVSGGGAVITPGTNSSTLSYANPGAALNGFRFRVSVNSGADIYFDFTVKAPTIVYVNGALSSIVHDGHGWPTAYNTLKEALDVSDAFTDIWVAKGDYRPASGSWTLVNGVRILGGFLGNEAVAADRNPATRLVRFLPQGKNNIFNNFYVSPRLTTKTVVDGVTCDGEGKILTGMRVEAGSVTLRNVTFTGFADRAMKFHRASDSLAENCTFTANPGGAVDILLSKPSFTGCTFKGNTTAYSGAGIQQTDGAVKLTACTFLENVAGEQGGAYYQNSGSLTIQRCRFEDNASGYYGGAVQMLNGALAVQNTLFVGNSTLFYGGGLATDFGPSTAAITNCTFTENKAVGGANGALYTGSAQVQVRNSIFWDNTDKQSTTTEAKQLGKAAEAGTLTVGYSVVQGLSTFTGNNNQLWDPLFMDRDAGDFRLNQKSPAVETADQSVSIGSLDLAGQPREYWDGIDRGAYETQFAPQTPSAYFLQVPRSIGVAVGYPGSFTGILATGTAVTDLLWEEPFGSSVGDTVTINNGAVSTLTIPNATAYMVDREDLIYHLRHLPSNYESAPLYLHVFQPRIIYVNYAATGTNKGTSWPNAFTSLSSALADATAYCEIWVAQGTYAPKGGGQSFTLKPFVTVYGGFLGTEAVATDRKPNLHETVLTSDGADIFDNYIYDNSIDATAVLDGFTLTAVDGWTAMSNQAASPTLRNLLFKNNTGLALYAHTSSSLVENCRFEGNTGGGAYSLRAPQSSRVAPLKITTAPSTARSPAATPMSHCGIAISLGTPAPPKAR